MSSLTGETEKSSSLPIQKSCLHAKSSIMFLPSSALCHVEEKRESEWECFCGMQACFQVANGGSFQGEWPGFHCTVFQSYTYTKGAAHLVPFHCCVLQEWKVVLALVALQKPFQFFFFLTYLKFELNAVCCSEHPISITGLLNSN